MIPTQYRRANDTSRCDSIAEARPKRCDRTPKAPSRGWYRFRLSNSKETVCEVVLVIVFLYLFAYLITESGALLLRVFNSNRIQKYLSLFVCGLF